MAADPANVLVVRSNRFADNRLFFAPVKDLPFSQDEPEMQVHIADDHSLSATLTGVGYHHFVHLSATQPATVFSDNYFDLQAGETRTVRVVLPGATLEPADVKLGSFHR
jgi:beta-mannosidase